MAPEQSSDVIHGRDALPCDRLAWGRAPDRGMVAPSEQMG